MILPNHDVVAWRHLGAYFLRPIQIHSKQRFLNGCSSESIQLIYMYYASKDRIIQVLEITSRLACCKINSTFTIKRQIRHPLAPARSPQLARLATPAGWRPASRYWSTRGRGARRHKCFWTYVKRLDGHPLCLHICIWAPVLCFLRANHRPGITDVTNLRHQRSVFYGQFLPKIEEKVANIMPHFLKYIPHNRLANDSDPQRNAHSIFC